MILIPINECHVPIIIIILSGLRREEELEEERMWVSQRSAEEEYRKKLEIALASPHVDKEHPMRRALSTSGRQRSQMNDILQQS